MPARLLSRRSGPVQPRPLTLICCFFYTSWVQGVLLGQFRAKALRSAWVVVELEVSKHDDTQFRRDLAMLR